MISLWNKSASSLAKWYYSPAGTRRSLNVFHNTEPDGWQSSSDQSSESGAGRVASSISDPGGRIDARGLQACPVAIDQLRCRRAWSHRLTRNVTAMSFTLVEQARSRLQRSELAVPGSNTALFEKSAKSRADMVFLDLDLEDAVAPDDKEHARPNVIAVLNDSEWGGQDDDGPHQRSRYRLHVP